MTPKFKKTQSICKGLINPKVILPTVGFFLLGFRLDGCHKASMSSLVSQHKKKQTAYKESTSRNSSQHFRGKVSCLDKNHQIGLIQVAGPTGFIVCTSRDLTQCSAITLSKKGITICYSNGHVEACSKYIAVDNMLLDSLAKEANPLLDKNNNVVEATHTNDFALTSSLDYGIDASTKVISRGSIVVEGSATKLQSIQNAYYLLTKSTSNLGDLIKSFLKQRKDKAIIEKNYIICPTLVVGNKLQSVEKRLDNVNLEDYNTIYCCIEDDNRYKLISLNHTGLPVESSQHGGFGTLNKKQANNPGKAEAPTMVPSLLNNEKRNEASRTEKPTESKLSTEKLNNAAQTHEDPVESTPLEPKDHNQKKDILENTSVSGDSNDEDDNGYGSCSTTESKDTLEKKWDTSSTGSHIIDDTNSNLDQQWEEWEDNDLQKLGLTDSTSNNNKDGGYHPYNHRSNDNSDSESDRFSVCSDAAYSTGKVDADYDWDEDDSLTCLSQEVNNTLDPNDESAYVSDTNDDNCSEAGSNISKIGWDIDKDPEKPNIGNNDPEVDHSEHIKDVNDDFSLKKYNKKTKKWKKNAEKHYNLYFDQ